MSPDAWEIFVFNTANGKVYSYPRTIDGSAIVPYEPVIPDAEGEMKYSYTAQSRLLTAAAEGFMPGVQVTIVVTAKDGSYLGYHQQTVDENGQVKSFFILPEIQKELSRSGSTMRAGRHSGKRQKSGRMKIS